jgi:hypothetical protein
MTWLAGQVARAYAELDIGAAMRCLAELTRFDRYQGSAGIGAAADFVADAAQRAGLDVEVLRFPADGRTAWWTFTAPAAWTPRSAVLSLRSDEAAGLPPMIRYPGQPYSLAANSRPTGSEPLVVPVADSADTAWPPHALVLFESPTLLSPQVFERLRERRAAGFAVVTHPGAAGQLGRVELAAGTGLFGFSVDAGQLARLRAAGRTGDRAVIAVDADTGFAQMPVVVARTPGGGEEETLLCAHLCHPAPGANDNGSGVAAAIAIGQLLARRPLRRAVRFVWGPEFTGLASYLHAVVGRGAAPRPLAAVNLDMVGEDQRLCGGPLIIEQSPEYLPHVLNAVADACVRAVPPAARSYSGAVGCDVWAWRSTPFVGASDHALLADRATGCPAIQIGHWPDRFNHSSADGLDKVDPQEIRRAASVAAGVLAGLGEADERHARELADVVVRWSAARMVRCLPPPADTGEPDAARPATAVGDHGGERAAALLARRAEFGRGALCSLRAYGAPDDLLTNQAQWLDGLHRQLALALRTPSSGGTRERATGPRPSGITLARRWPGPFNLRALIAACAPEDRRWLDGELAADRGRCYAIAMALAQGIDGAADAGLLISRAALDSGLPIETGFGLRFLRAMVRAGWAGPDHGPQAPDQQASEPQASDPQAAGLQVTERRRV